MNITEPDGKLYIFTDSHLDETIAPTSQFVEMLRQLEDPHTVVFLGDLFVIWLAPPKFLDRYAPYCDVCFSGFERQRVQCGFYSRKQRYAASKKIQ